MEPALKEILAAFPGKRVIVVGDVMVDEFIWGNSRRISPEAPVPVVEVRQRTHLPGGAANTAVNVASLGGHVLLGGVVGADAASEKLRAALADRGVPADSLMVDPSRVTTSKTRVMAQGKHVVRVDEERPAPLAAELENQLLTWAAREMPTAHACLLADYAKGVVSTRLARELLDLARQAGKPSIVDPNGTNLMRYRGATVVKPNLQEARRFCRADDDALDLEQIGRQLTEAIPGSALLVTCGPEGMALFRAGVPTVTIASAARAVFDVTGAGDTVAGTLALALAAGASLELAAHLANRAAGIVVGKVGTAAVTREELLADLS
jgi:D-beta-D-heptose 7-phosphate kinase/D-beta-D-heptose 1-phosphate adenosyltransferase